MVRWVRAFEQPKGAWRPPAMDGTPHYTALRFGAGDYMIYQSDTPYGTRADTTKHAKHIATKNEGAKSWYVWDNLRNRWESGKVVRELDKILEMTGGTDE